MSELELMKHQVRPSSQLALHLKNEKKIIILKGDTGVGKSHIISNLTSSFSIPSILYLVGDTQDRFEDFTAIKRAHFSVFSNNELRDHNSILIESAKDLPYIGNTLGSILSKYVSRKDKQNLFTDSRYIETYLMLKKLIHFGKDVIILDNVYLFDEHIKYFFKKILESADSIGGLKSIIIVLSNERDKAFLDWLNTITERIEIVDVFKPSRIELNEHLHKISNGGITSVSSKLIFDFCDGNLSLLNLIIFALKNNEISFSKSEEDANRKKILLDIIKNKLSHFDNHSEFIDSVLTIASCIGLDFELNELKYVLNEEADKCKFAIECSQKVNLTDIVTDTTYKFSHELIRDLFLEKSRDNFSLETNFLKVEKCLQHLNPSLYKARADLLYRGNEIFGASIFMVLSLIQHLREGLQIDFSDSNDLSMDKILPEHLEYFKRMNLAYDYFNKDDFKNCLAQLSKVPFGLPIELGFEKDYLLCLVEKKKNGSGDRIKELVINMEFYEKQLTNEYELSSRCASTLIALYYDCLHDSTKTEIKTKALVSQHLKRAVFDTNALYHLNILYRKFKMIFSSEMAIDWTAKSLNYFKNTSYEKQLLKSLCNHTGNLISLGRYAEAFIMLEENLIDFDFLNNGYYLYNNIILAGVFSEKFSLVEGATYFDKLISSSLDIGDAVLITNNYLALKALDGQYKYVIEEINALLDKSVVQDEDYYYYFLASNLVSAYILENEVEKARNIFLKIKDKIPYICKNEKIFFLRRHDVISKILSDSSCITLEKFTLMFTEDMDDYEESWIHIGKPFLVSDLQYWSES